MTDQDARRRPSPHTDPSRAGGIETMIATRFIRGMVALVVLSSIAGPAGGQEPPAPPAKVEVFPPEVNLTTAADRQSVVVQATYADGITRDVTRDAAMTLDNPALVHREGPTFHPAADGAGTLKVEYSGRSLSVP